MKTNHAALKNWNRNEKHAAAAAKQVIKAEMKK